MKRLIRKAEVYLDVDNRHSAISYINGEVLVGETHAETVNQYLESKNQNGLPSNTFRPTNEVLDESGVDQMAFAHLFEEDDLIPDFETGKSIYVKAGIYIEKDSLINIDMNTVSQAFKNAFPNYDVFEFTEGAQLIYEKVAKLYKNR